MALAESREMHKLETFLEDITLDNERAEDKGLPGKRSP